jgi:hypothetical protein
MLTVTMNKEEGYNAGNMKRKVFKSIGKTHAEAD